MGKGFIARAGLPYKEESAAQWWLVSKGSVSAPDWTAWLSACLRDLSVALFRGMPQHVQACLNMPDLARPFSPLLLLPPIPPSVRVFFNESTLRIRWPEYWSFSFSIIPSKEIPWLISFRMDWLDFALQSKGFSRVFSNTTVQKHQFFSAQLSSQSNSHIHT